MGTIRSVSSLPRGTLSQEPEPGRSMTESSSRSSSSPIRSPQARCSSSASAASRCGEASSASVRRRSASRWQEPRQGLGQSRVVGGEHQPPGGCVGPAPLGDVGQEVRDGQDPSGLLRDGQGPAGLGVRRGGQAGQPGFDVLTPVQRRGGRVRVDAGEVGAERCQPGGQRGDGGGTAGDGLVLQVAHQDGVHRLRHVRPGAGRTASAARTERAALAVPACGTAPSWRRWRWPGSASRCGRSRPGGRRRRRRGRRSRRGSGRSGVLPVANSTRAITCEAIAEATRWLYPPERAAARNASRSCPMTRAGHVAPDRGELAVHQVVPARVQPPGDAAGT